MRAKEIANARLAMLACLGAIVQANVTGARPFENLFSHLADPGHATIFQVFQISNHIIFFRHAAESLTKVDK